MAGEIGTIERFAGESSLALYVGMAPLDHSSGVRSGSKPPRHVNTRAKAAMMIATAQNISVVTESRNFYEKKRTQEKTTTMPCALLAVSWFVSCGRCSRPIATTCPLHPTRNLEDSGGMFEHRCGAALSRNRLDHHNAGGASRIAERPIARRNRQTQAQSQFEIGGAVAG